MLVLSQGKTVVYQWAALTSKKQFMILYAQRGLIFEARKWAKEQCYYYFDPNEMSPPSGT
jgi:hypothetical protein